MAIRIKLSTLGNLMIALMVLTAAASVLVANQTSRGVDNLQSTWTDYAEVNSRKVAILHKITANLGYGGMIHLFKDYVLVKDKSLVTTLQGRMDAIGVAIDAYRKLPLSRAEAASLEQIEATIELYRNGLSSVEIMIDSQTSAEDINSSLYMNDRPAIEAVETLTRAVLDAEFRASDNMKQAAAGTVRFSRLGAVVIATLLGVTILVMIWFLNLRLLRPIRELNQVMVDLAGGDIAVTVPDTNRQDEIGAMARSVQVFKNSAVRTASMRNHVDSIVTRIREIADRSSGALGQQAVSTTQQAAAASETSTALIQIRETSQRTVERADGLAGAAKRTLDRGQEGQQQMEQVVQAMSGIRDRVDAIAHTMMALSEQTRRVGEITDSVNTLAQQSKMLAINASIEAAKAGEAGKGFAVVAEEVANLADQSEQATQQVRGVLDQIRAASEKAIFATEEGTKQVDSGVTLINGVGQNIHALLEVIGETVEATGTIVESIQQQSAGIGQVSDAMNNISESTGQIAGSTGEINQAIEMLGGLLDEMAQARTNLRHVGEEQPGTPHSLEG